jgi:hypothetical protein
MRHGLLDIHHERHSKVPGDLSPLTGRPTNINIPPTISMATTVGHLKVEQQSEGNPRSDVGRCFAPDNGECRVREALEVR